MKAYTTDNPDVNTKVVLCGDKVKAALQRTHPEAILCAFNELGRKPPLFEVSPMFSRLLQNIKIDNSFKYSVITLEKLNHS